LADSQIVGMQGMNHVGVVNKDVAERIGTATCSAAK
jgi:hypothetical protein